MSLMSLGMILSILKYLSVDSSEGPEMLSGGQSGHERFAFTRLHFGDFAVVQDHAADQLHIEMAHFQETATSFADQREGWNNRRLDGLAHRLPESGLGRIQILERRLNRLFE